VLVGIGVRAADTRRGRHGRNGRDGRNKQVGRARARAVGDAGDVCDLDDVGGAGKDGRGHGGDGVGGRAGAPSRSKVVLGLLLLLHVHLLEVGLGVRPPLALQVVLPHKKRQNGDGGDSSNDSSSDGTDIGLVGLLGSGHGVDGADNLWARIAGLGSLDADLVLVADLACAGELCLFALHAALLDAEDILHVCAALACVILYIVKAFTSQRAGGHGHGEGGDGGCGDSGDGRSQVCQCLWRAAVMDVYNRRGNVGQSAPVNESRILGIVVCDKAWCLVTEDKGATQQVGR